MRSARTSKIGHEEKCFDLIHSASCVTFFPSHLNSGRFVQWNIVVFSTNILYISILNQMPNLFLLS